LDARQPREFDPESCADDVLSSRWYRVPRFELPAKHRQAKPKT